MTLRRVFVANRGEIAVRIVAGCRALGIESVVGFSDADRGSLASELADRAVCIGPGPAADSYLRPDLIVTAALATGCDAIHPGYGFLAESPRLAALAAEHGLVFVGPPAAVIELAGDKLAARAQAVAAGLPVVPGREVGAAHEAQRFAHDAGFPVLLKAAGGGGGRGIKLARDAAMLDARFDEAVAEAGAAFADERVYVERFVGAARHVEVQIAADAHGHVLHLGERDCSIQRRYQKLVEEAPAPALDPALRDALRAGAVAFATRIGYTNLGTVEFIVDVASGVFFFLEMNCRIQVEHPVTEALTGLDLIALQLRIAAGEPLGMTQADVAFAGHAVECRLTAEDVARDFAPSPGRITRFDVPVADGLRVDTHCRAGTAVPPYYDSLLAKLIGHGPDRAAAIDVVRAALDGLRVEGVATNRELLADVLAHPDFVAGPVTTTWLAEAIA
jgi:acetyl-CoA carboxylase, biotin carboxylase subunit